MEDRLAALIFMPGYGSGGYVAGRLAALMLLQKTNAAKSDFLPPNHIILMT
jgi:hypothetical protein